MPSFFRKNIGWITIFILAVLPIFRWLFLSPLQYRFLDINTTSTSLGQITGLLGMSLFSLNLILSSRLHILDRFYDGLNNVYKYHTRLGAIAFSLLLFHPLFLAVKYLQISVRSAALFLLPSADLAITYGIIALAGMIVLLVLTFYIRLKYNHWKISHKFLVAVFIFAILHNLFIVSDISRDTMLRFYIFSLAFFGLAASFYQAFLSGYFNRNARYQVKEVNRPNSAVWEIVLQPQNKPIKFVAGQFVFIRLLGQGLSSESHPFSIASAPGESNLKLVIKSLGDYTSRLGNLKTGDQAEVSGPFGKFSYRNITNRKQIWLAGGIGITPFLSMARDFSDDGYLVNLYYCVNKNEEAVYLEELMKISSAHNNLKIMPWCSVEKGRIDSRAITQSTPDWKERDIMICGPAPFMQSLRQQFLSLGIADEKIHWENFNFI